MMTNENRVVLVMKVGSKREDTASRHSNKPMCKIEWSGRKRELRSDSIKGAREKPRFHSKLPSLVVDNDEREM